MISNRTTSKRGKGKSSHRFANTPSIAVPRSTFDRSCGRTTTFNEGDIVPILVDEVLPGDTIKIRMTSFARMLATTFPVMDNMYMDFFFFFVPNRLVWDNWQKFMGEQIDPGDSTDFLIPTMVQPTVGEGGVSDHFGIPIGNHNLEFSSLFHRGHNLIFNEWFRDQNLTDSLPVPRDDGPDTPGDFSIQKRCKKHDYFTSCLPFAQKGTAVSIPLGTTAPVNFATPQQAVVGTGTPSFEPQNDAGVTVNLKGIDGNDGTKWSGDPGEDQAMKWVAPELEVNLSGAGGTADLTNASAATINQLRVSFAIQKMLERDARAGTRYTEICKSHFGITPSDGRLQRPEYLGGGSTRIMINPVTAMIANTTNNLGDLGAFATAASDGIGFTKSFEEHGMLYGYVNVRAELTYQQGLPRMFSRETRADHYFPALAHLGEQAVLSQEIFADGSAGDQDVFGYQERWSEYRYKPSDVTGAMRSEAVSSLDPWHLALHFQSRPLLNDVFIQDNPPIDRVVSVPSEDHFKGDFWFDYKITRCMPTNSIPGMIDRF